MKHQFLIIVAIATYVFGENSFDASPPQLVITDSGSSSHNGEGFEIIQSGSGHTTIKGNPYSISQAESAVLHCSGSVAHSVTQRESGVIDIGGSSGGPINTAGSGVLDIRGGGAESRTFIQAGSGIATVTGNLKSVYQEGSSVLYCNGNVQESVTQYGSGKIDIIGTAGGPVSKHGTGVIHIGGRVFEPKSINPCKYFFYALSNYK